MLPSTPAASTESFVPSVHWKKLSTSLSLYSSPIQTSSCLNVQMSVLLNFKSLKNRDGDGLLLCVPSSSHDHAVTTIVTSL